MLQARYLALATLCAATVAMAGCTGDNPAQNPTQTGTSGGTITDPFAALGKGAASLQQAAGMAGDARSSGLTTVAPLQQAAGYRVNAVDDYEDEADGPFTTTFHIASESITGDWTSDITVYKGSDYVTKNDDGAEVEKGQAARKLHLKNETDKYSVDVFDFRQVATSSRRPVGVYGTFGLQTLTATSDVKALIVYHEPTGQASTSLTVVMVDQYAEGTGDTLAKKIASRGTTKIAEAVVLKGTLPTGETIDFTRGRANQGNLQGRYFEGSLDLGANGKVGLKSTMGWAFTSTQPDFPSVATGSVTITKKTSAGAVEGEIVINKFDCVPAQQIAHTTGILKNAQGAAIGAFEGLISKRTGKWLGTYQMTGQASKSIDFSGIIEHMM